MMRNEMEQEYGNDEVLGNTCRQRRRQCGGRLQNGNATRGGDQVFCFRLGRFERLKAHLDRLRRSRGKYDDGLA